MSEPRAPQTAVGATHAPHNLNHAVSEANKAVPPGHSLFFVYGTLRQSGANDITRLQPAPHFIGRTHISGTMADLGGYPGVTLGGPGRVVGEVYAVSAVLEAKLDAIEAEYPVSGDVYFKRDIAVLVNGQSLTCSVYEISASSVQGKPVIVSGDWIENGG
jgi:gamma-glutamylcyclotransferase (GGCT)/AIG2-like uncharacterized protein YtfP